MNIITETAIPWSRRILGALSTFLLTILVGLGCLLVAPIAALNVLLTSKEYAVKLTIPSRPKSAPPNPNPDDGESWKREHDQEYGNGA